MGEVPTIQGQVINFPCSNRGSQFGGGRFDVHHRRFDGNFLLGGANGERNILSDRLVHIDLERGDLGGGESFGGAFQVVYPWNHPGKNISSRIVGDIGSLRASCRVGEHYFRFWNDRTAGVGDGAVDRASAALAKGGR